MRRVVIAIITPLMLSVSSLQSSSFAGSLEITQMGQWVDDKIDSVKDYVQFAKNVKHNLDQLKTMRTNLKKLGSRDWIDFEDQVRELKRLVNYQDALTYAAANYETLFKNKYKNYDAFVRMYQGTTGVRDFTQEYKTLNKSTRNTVESALKQLNLSMDDMEDDKVVMDRLKGLSKSSVGQKQAISVVSQISLHSIEQLKKLEKVLMSNHQLHVAWIAKQNAREEMEDAAHSTRVPANGRDLTINYGKAY
ncbi:MAG TPA: P-type conjugative transfer protein TrbJ [Sulfurovum sp.]|nr:P-type conjugative transfer protein TrbJ [Sulfurovum sp.]